MFTHAQIRREVEHYRTVHGKMRFTDPEATEGQRVYQGYCREIGEVVYRLGDGQHWWSDECLAFPQQIHSGHAIGVIPDEGGRLCVVDFTLPPEVDTIRAVLPEDVWSDDHERIATELEAETGYPGWTLLEEIKNGKYMEI